MICLGVLLSACDGPQRQQQAAAEVAPIDGAADLAVIAYYTGDGMDLARYDFNKLTHVIYSFVHLDGNRLNFDNPEARATYQRLVALKQAYPHLKVMFALGGWGGCETCSEIFQSSANRSAFAQSTLDLLQEFGGDGLDLDWEYPSIEGYPGHAYGPQDKDNFSALVKILRDTLGSDYLLTFAAGGFDQFLHDSVDWRAVVPLVDHVNLMAYDLVNGFSQVTGHHTPLYSTEPQYNSTDNAVSYLLSLGVPPNKIVIGAAFYSRVWEQVAPNNNGLYQAGVHVPGLPFSEIPTSYTAAQGWQYLWDEVAMAPYAYNSEEKRFATFDDVRSITLKTRYVREHQLGGIMFWQLPGDSDQNGLVDAIYAEKNTPGHKLSDSPTL
jgi:chitinase